MDWLVDTMHRENHLPSRPVSHGLAGGYYAPGESSSFPPGLPWTGWWILCTGRIIFLPARSPMDWLVDTMHRENHLPSRPVSHGLAGGYYAPGESSSFPPGLPAPAVRFSPESAAHNSPTTARQTLSVYRRRRLKYRKGRRPRPRRCLCATKLLSIGGPVEVLAGK